MMWCITVEVLEELGETGILMSGENLTYLQIYGPNGKMSHYFSETWSSADHMRSDLMQNHGGGVPVDVIEKHLKLHFGKWKCPQVALNTVDRHCF